MAALAARKVVEAEPEEARVQWPIAIETAVDDPARRDRLIAANRLPQDLKRVLFRHLQKRHPDIVTLMQRVREQFGPVEALIQLDDASQRLHRILWEHSRNPVAETSASPGSEATEAPSPDPQE